ncbi:MAG: hypothetical protein ISN29_05505 [Gammaproteobacteria bacterium AqS3]|nr:hypothetical protein [Gammaproteobacteria bacterium AqS3]
MSDTPSHQTRPPVTPKQLVPLLLAALISLFLLLFYLRKDLNAYICTSVSYSSSYKCVRAEWLDKSSWFGVSDTVRVSPSGETNQIDRLFVMKQKFGGYLDANELFGGKHHSMIKPPRKLIDLISNIISDIGDQIKAILAQAGAKLSRLFECDEQQGELVVVYCENEQKICELSSKRIYLEDFLKIYHQENRETQIWNASLQTYIRYDSLRGLTSEDFGIPYSPKGRFYDGNEYMSQDIAELFITPEDFTFQPSPKGTFLESLLKTYQQESKDTWTWNVSLKTYFSKESSKEITLKDISYIKPPNNRPLKDEKYIQVGETGLLEIPEVFALEFLLKEIHLENSLTMHQQENGEIRIWNGVDLKTRFLEDNSNGIILEDFSYIKAPDNYSLRDKMPVELYKIPEISDLDSHGFNESFEIMAEERSKGFYLQNNEDSDSLNSLDLDEP